MNSADSIDPHLLHKDTPRDVLIGRPRLILPSFLSASIGADILAGPPQDQDLFKQLYRAQDGRYVLRHLPLTLSAEQAGTLSTFEIRLADFYTECDDRFILTAEFIPHQAQRYLAQHFQGDDAHIPPDQVIRMIECLESLAQWDKARQGSYLLINDTKNYYFYNKQHEHVPGLMLIEVARQAMYHYVYNYLGHQRGAVSISIEDLRISFNAYTESAYEVEVVVQQTHGLKRSQPKSIDKCANFYQNGRLVSRLWLQGAVIKLPLFKRMRSLNYPQDHWFTPSDRLPKNILVHHADSALQARLSLLSVLGVLVTHQAEGINWSTVTTVSLYIEGGGFLSLPVASTCSTGEPDQRVLVFDKLSKSQASELRETIKCHCFFAGQMQWNAGSSPDPLAPEQIVA